MRTPMTGMEGKGRRKVLLCASIVFGAAVMFHASSLKHSFVGDDFNLVVNNEFISEWKNVAILFDPRYLFVPYPIKCGARPLTVLSLMVDKGLWGSGPSGFHLTNILLHGLNSTLVFLLVMMLLGCDSIRDVIFFPTVRPKGV